VLRDEQSPLNLNWVGESLQDPIFSLKMSHKAQDAIGTLRAISGILF
jgi:hypothetical protein